MGPWGRMDQPHQQTKRSGGLTLTPALRTELGIEEREALHLIERSSRTILLERVGEDLGEALPRGCELVLMADVRAFPLAEVLGRIQTGGKSGLLLLAHRQHAKSVYIHRGEVVFASSNQRTDRLGECLLRAGVIRLEQLREAEQHFTPPERFGKVLVEHGFLTPRELWHGVKYQVEEVVRSLFAYTEGRFYFWEGDIQPDNVVRLSLPTHRLVSEGVQRRDELLKFLAMLEDPRVHLAVVPGVEKSLTTTERTFLEAVASERIFGGVVRKTGLDPLSVARTVQLLRLVGAIKLMRSGESDRFFNEADLRVHDQELLRASITNHVKLLAELAAPIAAVEGATALRGRFEKTLDEAAGRFPALLSGLRVGAAVTLDPEELVGRALRLGEDAEAQVSAALGELVAYLEFELKNHPSIQDPDRSLATLTDLRSKLKR